MKKSTQKSKSRSSFISLSKLQVILAAFVAALIVGLGVYVFDRIHYYDDAAEQANMTEIRELILLAVRGVKKDAPVDAKSGDIYFPEAHLYLPNPKLALPLTYQFDDGAATDPLSGLSISTYPVRSTEALYTARNMTQLFADVPKLQACSRGVKLTYATLPASDTQDVLHSTLQLHNGQELHIYLEKACSELNSTADLLKNIQSY